MERFDVTFASRYFAALNGHFHPGQFPSPTHSWLVAFNGALLPARRHLRRAAAEREVVHITVLNTIAATPARVGVMAT